MKLPLLTFAIADINAAGGVLGKKIKLEVGDDACDPKQAVAPANKTAGLKAALVAGHFCSGSSIPASAVYAKQNILQISPGSTNPKYTDELPGPTILTVAAIWAVFITSPTLPTSSPALMPYCPYIGRYR